MRQNQLFARIRRHLIPCLAIVIGGLSATALVILFAPRSYHSQAKLLLRLGRESVSLDPTITTTGETASLYRTRDSEVNTALQAMRSRSILEQVVDQVGQEAILRGSLEAGSSKGSLLGSIKHRVGSWISSIDPIDDRERAVMELDDGLDIDAQRESSVIDVRYQSKSPELAQAVTQTWIAIYRKEHARMNSTEGSLGFFNTEEQELLSSLKLQRAQLQDKKSKFGLVTVVGQQEILEHQIELAKNSELQTNSSLAASIAKVDALRAQLDQTDQTMVTSETTVDSNEARDRMRDRLYALEIQERDLSTKYTKDNPVYLGVLQQLKEVRQVYQSERDDASEVVQGVNPIHLSIREQLFAETANQKALEAQRDEIDRQLRQLNKELATFNQNEAELAAIQRQVDVLESRYREHYEKREQARLATELENQQISNINVIQPASLEKRPISPNKKLCALVGVLGTLLMTVGWVVIRESATVSVDIPIAIARESGARTSEPATRLVRSDSEQPLPADRGSRLVSEATLATETTEPATF
ncbi:MAG: GumC family protein [Planctomycetota bacterium]